MTLEKLMNVFASNLTRIMNFLRDKVVVLDFDPVQLLQVKGRGHGHVAPGHGEGVARDGDGIAVGVDNRQAAQDIVVRRGRGRQSYGLAVFRALLVRRHRAVGNLRVNGDAVRGRAAGRGRLLGKGRQRNAHKHAERHEHGQQYDEAAPVLHVSFSLLVTWRAKRSPFPPKAGESG